MLRATLRTPLVIATATVAGLGLAVELVHTGSHAEAVEVLVGLCSLSYEQNLPTWFAAVLLAANACLFAAIGLETRRWARHWLGLAAGFAVMSLDETAELHERLAGVIDGGDVVYFNWIIPAAAMVGVLTAVFWPFLRALPGPRRRELVGAAALFLGGAVVMELPLGWWTAHAGPDNAGYALIDWVEESLELAGAAWCLLALAGRWDERAEATP